MDSECLEMDLSTRQRDAPQQDPSCKIRAAKSVFSIRSLVDLGEVGGNMGAVSNGSSICESARLARSQNELLST
ncbi:hypothetical protein JTB14_007403 [Gonioctena quinquepunctata]|nr:hypothetical protein JTB14_007403 [Gonioctena quinquepunctata]